MITIIIPLFNKKRTIERCIDSVINQSSSNWELIIVDDGSTDGSSEIALAKCNSEPRARYMLQKNQGPGTARNAGAKLAKGSWFVFLDADDYLATDALSTFNSLYKNNADVNILLFSSQWYNEDLSRVPSMLSSSSNDEIWQLSLLDSLPKLSELESFLNSFVMGCIFIKKEIFFKYGKFYSKNNYNFGEDAYLWIKIILNEPILVCSHISTFIDSSFSELGLGRNRKPLPAYIIDSQSLFVHCPEKLKKLLCDFLNYKAHFLFKRELYYFKLYNSWWLTRKYPGLKYFHKKKYINIYLYFIIIPFLKIYSKISRRLCTS